MAYAHAPITEAVLDIQVRLSSLPATSVFEGIAKDLRGSFPEHVNANQFQLNVAFNAAGQPTASAQPLGVGQRLTSATNDRVLLVQPKGMSLSHLAPYSEWPKFRQEGVAAWRKYVEYVKPDAVTRVALRYINRIYVPAHVIQLEDYFNIYPEAPNDHTQPISQFFMQIQVPQSDLGPDVAATVNFASAGLGENTTRVIMLDIDLFAMQELPIDEGIIFSRLDQLRVRKNELFESYITNKTRESFK